MNIDPAKVIIYFSGVNITDDISPYLVELQYVDNEAEAADDLRITISDAGLKWLQDYVGKVQIAASNANKVKYSNGTKYRVVSPGGLRFRRGPGDNYPVAGVLAAGTYVSVAKLETGWATINVNGQTYYCNSDYIRKEHDVYVDPTLKLSATIISSGSDMREVLDCGYFEFDELDYDSNPSQVTIKATSLPYSSGLRTISCKSWNKVRFSEIVKSLADSANMTYFYLPSSDPIITSELKNETPAAYLCRIAAKYGFNVRFSSNAIIVYKRDSSIADAITIKKDGSVMDFSARIGKADTQYSRCQVSYTNPSTGKAIIGYAYDTSYDADNKHNTTMYIKAKCSTQAEAERLALYYLRKRNCFAKTAAVTIPGNPRVCGGTEVTLSGYGVFDGVYVVASATHKVGSDGYTTDLDLRNKMES